MKDPIPSVLEEGIDSKGRATFIVVSKEILSRDSVYASFLVV